MMYVTIQFFYTIGTASCKLIQLSQWNEIVTYFYNITISVQPNWVLLLFSEND